MISLKKNDKIVIIIAIVILVVAGAGVAMYQSPQPRDNIFTENLGQKSYNVTWMIRNGSLPVVSDFAHKKTPYEGTARILNGNIKSISFNMSWTDDRMTMLKRMGLDTLTLDVSTPDGMTYTQSNTSARKTGKATISLTVNTGFIPPKTAIEAPDEKDAQMKLQTKPYFDDSWTDKDITLRVSVKIGELRLLKKMRDNGNDFELKITYQYYDGALELDTTKNTGGETYSDDYWNDEAQATEPPYISMIISTGCGRFI